MNVEDFQKHINMNIHLLKNHPNYVPFHAYTWGRHTKETNNILKDFYIIPVYIDGMKNYNDYQVIEIIAAIRDFDAKSKGIDSRQDQYDLLKDLIFHILSAPGDISF
jgi:hypothetical protein